MVFIRDSGTPDPTEFGTSASRHCPGTPVRLSDLILLSRPARIMKCAKHYEDGTGSGSAREEASGRRLIRLSKPASDPAVCGCSLFGTGLREGRRSCIVHSDCQGVAVRAGGPVLSRAERDNPSMGLGLHHRGAVRLMVLETDRNGEAAMLEVEGKFAVGNLDEIRSRLHRRGASMSGREREHDVYYNAPHRDFGETDEALRVRYTDSGCIVTYKGPKTRIGSAKAREEFNVCVSSGEIFESILSRTGFRRAAAVSKCREVYELDGATIVLDAVDDLGTFIEIEILTESEEEDAARRIGVLAKELGVDGPPLYTSYLEMLLSKQ
jgi:adenylate cyclase class 2